MSNNIELLTDDELIARFEYDNSFVVRLLVARLLEAADHAAGLQTDLDMAHERIYELEGALKSRTSAPKAA